MMTPMFPFVRELLGHSVRFVTVMRHPYNVVRSAQEVIVKSGRPFSDLAAVACARRLVDTYAHLDNPALANALFCFRYEDILLSETIEELRGFTGMPDIDKDKVGAKSMPAPSKITGSYPWFSPKYHQPIDTKSRLSPLAPEFRAIVKDIYGPLMDRFNYTDEL